MIEKGIGRIDAIDAIGAIDAIDAIDTIDTIEDIGDLSLREFGSEEIPQVGDGHDGIVQEHARA